MIFHLWIESLSLLSPYFDVAGERKCIPVRKR